MNELIKKLAILSESESDKILLNKPDIESVIKDHLKLVDIKNTEIATENALLLDTMYRNSAAQQTRRDFCQVTNPVFDKKFINLIQEIPVECSRIEATSIKSRASSIYLVGSWWTPNFSSTASLIRVSW